MFDRDIIQQSHTFGKGMNKDLASDLVQPDSYLDAMDIMLVSDEENQMLRVSPQLGGGDIPVPQSVFGTTQSFRVFVDTSPDIVTVTFKTVGRVSGNTEEITITTLAATPALRLAAIITQLLVYFSIDVGETVNIISSGDNLLRITISTTTQTEDYDIYVTQGSVGTLVPAPELREWIPQALTTNFDIVTMKSFGDNLFFIVNSRGITLFCVAKKNLATNAWISTVLLQTKKISVSSSNVFSVTIEQNNDFINIHWCDGDNKPRLFTVKRQNFWAADSALRYTFNNWDFESTTGVYTLNGIDEAINLQLFNSTARITDVVVNESGGVLKAGNKQFAIAYKVGGSYTEYAVLSNPTPIRVSNTFIGGGGEGGVETGRSITLTISDLKSQIYDKFRLGVIEYAGGAVSAFALGDFDITGTEQTILVTGLENPIFIDVNEFRDFQPYIKTAHFNDIVENRLFLGRVELEQDPPIEDWVRDVLFNENNIIVHTSTMPQVGFVGGTLEPNEYFDPTNCKDKVGYMYNDLYRFGVRFHLKNGYVTKTYFGRDLKITNVSGGGVLNNGTDTYIYHPRLLSVNLNTAPIVNGVSFSQLVDFVEIMRQPCIENVVDAGYFLTVGEVFDDIPNNRQRLYFGGKFIDPVGGSNTFKAARQLPCYAFVSQRTLIKGQYNFPTNPDNVLVYLGQPQANQNFVAPPLVGVRGAKLTEYDGEVSLGQNSEIPFTMNDVRWVDYGQESSKVTINSGDNLANWERTSNSIFLDRLDKLPFNVALTAGAWNSTTNEYTVPVGGKYSVELGINFTLSFENIISQLLGNNYIIKVKVRQNGVVLGEGVTTIFIPTVIIPTTRFYNRTLWLNLPSVNFNIGGVVDFIWDISSQSRTFPIGNTSPTPSTWIPTLRVNSGSSFRIQRVLSSFNVIGSFKVINPAGSNPPIYITNNTRGFIGFPNQEFLDLAPSNPFNGNAYYAQIVRGLGDDRYGNPESGIYQSTGTMIDARTTKQFTNVDVFGGDTYTQKCWHKMSARNEVIDPGGNLLWALGVSYYAQNRFNAQLTYTARQNPALVYPVNTENIYNWLVDYEDFQEPRLYDNGFTASYLQQTSVPFRIDAQDVSTQSTTVYYSEQKVEGELGNPFRVVRALNSKSFELSDGVINGMHRVRDNLLVVQERATVVQNISPDIVVGVENNIGAILGTGSVMGTKEGTVTRFGATHKTHVKYYFDKGGQEYVMIYDNLNKVLVRHGRDGIRVLSIENSVDSFFKNNTSRLENEFDLVMGYNPYLEELIVAANRPTGDFYNPAFTYTTGQIVKLKADENIDVGFSNCFVARRNVPTNTPPSLSGENFEYWKPYLDNCFTIAFNERFNDFSTRYSTRARLYEQISNKMVSVYPYQEITGNGVYLIEENATKDMSLLGGGVIPFHPQIEMVENIEPNVYKGYVKGFLNIQGDEPKRLNIESEDGSKTFVEDTEISERRGYWIFNVPRDIETGTRDEGRKIGGYFIKTRVFLKQTTKLLSYVSTLVRKSRLFNT